MYETRLESETTLSRPRSKADQPLGLIDYFILLVLLAIPFGLSAAVGALFGPH
jgi:hypothetical protein